MALLMAITTTPAIVGVDSAGGHVTLDQPGNTAAAKTYTLRHTGKTTSGGSTSDLVAGGTADAPTASSYAEEQDKFVLAPGESITLDQQYATVYLKGSGSDDVALEILPGDITKVSEI